MTAALDAIRGLDEAWAAVEAVLPEGWRILLAGAPGGWYATASSPQDDRTLWMDIISTTANGRKPDPTPADAMRFLHAALRAYEDADKVADG